MSSEIIRHGKQCRERWNNHLDPSLKKSEWSTEEDVILLISEQKLSKKWSDLAKILKGRTENNIKNHRNSLLHKEKKKILDMKDDSEIKNF